LESRRCSCSKNRGSSILEEWSLLKRVRIEPSPAETDCVKLTLKTIKYVIIKKGIVFLDINDVKAIKDE
jgi:hypothetical protein